MPKKSVATRGGAQRQKARTQKAFALVRPETEEQDSEEQLKPALEVKSISTSTTTPTTPPQTERAEPEPEQAAKSVSTAVATQEAETKPISLAASTAPTTTKTSASTRVATRRQTTQRVQQRSAATLITAEHFAYVRHDLIRIATLAIIMFTAIIVLYFLFGRGA